MKVVRGTAAGDLLIVILLLIALGVAWFYAGGPSSALTHSGPFLSLPAPYGNSSGTAYTVPTVTNVGGGTGSSGSNTNSNESPVTTFSNYLGTFNEIESPYAKYVSLDRGTADSDYAQEYMTVRIASNAPQKITVSGWRIESTASGLGTTLPGATLLPNMGDINTNAPVALSAGDTAYIVTGRSPVGTSFRTNMCTGYFAQFQTFKPSLRLDCPSPEDEAARVMGGSYTDACHDTVNSIDRCDLMVSSVPAQAGAACQNFIQSTLTYNGCANAHKNDPAFYRNMWYLYLNRDQELWKSRYERIRLVDENGKVISVVTY